MCLLQNEFTERFHDTKLILPDTEPMQGIIHGKTTTPCLTDVKTLQVEHQLVDAYPADTRRWINVDLTLVHRLRRWTDVKPRWFNVLSAG